MYAAAGGASLASRQKQRQQKTKTKQMKNAAQKVSDLTPKPPQAKQFHNYTDSAVPRLSRVERGALKPPTPNERRHSTSNYLKEPLAKARIRESPSISIPIQPTHQSSQNLPQLSLSPKTFIQQNIVPNPSTFSLQSQLPQILVPEDGKSERRCSFVRQVEEVGRKESDVLDRCNHFCNFEIKDKQLETNTHYYTDFDTEIFGSLDYPFSECSQGRTAWQEKERGRRCSLSEEVRQHRIKQTEAHHRWMKRNRIHDTTYGGGSEDNDEYTAFHQSAAANALLYVGLGTTAIGSVIFFVGTGEKGFKTLELRLIGPTLVLVGLLCCLVRILLCACPSPCIRNCLRSRLNKSYPYKNNRRHLVKLPDLPEPSDLFLADKTALLHKHSTKKVSIVPPNYSLPSTSTSELKDLPSFTQEVEIRKLSIPKIHLPTLQSSDELSKLSREDSILELQTMDLYNDVQSLSSNESEGLTVIERNEKNNLEITQISSGKLITMQEPLISTKSNNTTSAVIQKTERVLSEAGKKNFSYITKTLNVQIEHGDTSENYNDLDISESSASQTNKKLVNDKVDTYKTRKAPSDKHSGIVLSPLQLGQ